MTRMNELLFATPPHSFCCFRNRDDDDDDDYDCDSWNQRQEGRRRQKRRYSFVGATVVGHHLRLSFCALMVVVVVFSLLSTACEGFGILPLSKLTSSSSKTVLFAKPKSPKSKKKQTQPQQPQPLQRQKTKYTSYSSKTALAVIPPDDAWDRLQRARHVGRDPSYATWPPAIRLFHPFVPLDDEYKTLQDAALDIATNVIEKYNIEPFEVTLSEWSVVPHTEALEAAMAVVEQLPYQTNIGDGSSIFRDMSSRSEEDRKVQDLIAREERIGKEKLKLRQEKSKMKQRRQTILQQQEQQQQQSNNNNNIQTNTTNSTTTGQQQQQQQQQQQRTRRTRAPMNSSPRSPPQNTAREHLEKQQTMYEEFNGPCVICLEPDANSRAKLQQLRYLLVQELFGAYDKCYSPSSSIGFVNPIAPVGGGGGEDGTMNYMVDTINHPTTTTTTTASSSQWLFRKKDAGRGGGGGVGKQQQQNPKQPAPAEDYRPVVPIASFQTVSAAIPMARKLRKLWKPIRFNVTDLQIISHGNGPLANNNNDDNYDMNNNYDDVEFGNNNNNHNKEWQGGSNNNNNNNNNLGTGGWNNKNNGVVVVDDDDDVSLGMFSNRNSALLNHGVIGTGEHPLDCLSTASSNQFGCDALISFMGEEIEMDDQFNQEMAAALFQQGEAGGGYPVVTATAATTNTTTQTKGEKQNNNNNNNNNSSNTTNILNREMLFDSEADEDDEPLHSHLLEQWLQEEDDDYDEGTVVVIGRTHFMTGEMRQYVGMPAASTLDARDRVLGNHHVSGAARRRSSVHRSPSLYEDGDWGRKKADYMPWSKAERRKRQQQQMDELFLEDN